MFGFNPLIGLAGAVLASVTMFGAGYLVGNSHGKDEVRQEWDKHRVEVANELARQQSQFRQREQELQRQADQRVKEKAREIADLGRRAAALADSLRDRPEARNADPVVPEAAGAAPAGGCTGAGLARPDADFLVRYAADAARLQLALNECRAGYQAAKDSLDAAGKVNGPAAP